MAVSAYEEKMLSVLSGSSEPNGPSAAAFEDSIRKNNRYMLQFVNTAALTGTNAAAEQVLGRARQKCALRAAGVTFAAAVTGGATNFFTLIIRKRTVALPGTQVALITYAASATPAGDAVAWAEKDLFALGNIAAGGFITNTNTDLLIGDGDTITAEVTKAGTGMTFPAGVVSLFFSPRD